VWPALPGLIAGRLPTGVAIGLMASTATAYLADLYRESRPDAPGSAVPGVVSTAANLGGLALRPLVVGVLAQWVPAPLATAYAIFGTLLLVVLVLVLTSPETVDREPQARRPAKFALQRGRSPAFAGAAAVGFFSFAVMGLFSSLGAIIIRGDLGITSHFIGGLARSPSSRCRPRPSSRSPRSPCRRCSPPARSPSRPGWPWSP
jgi:MFS family permease